MLFFPFIHIYYIYKLKPISDLEIENTFRVIPTLHSF